MNNASSGDEILVAPGTYTENIVISKDNLVLRSQSGNPEDTIITASDPSTHVITIPNRLNVTIKGLKITNAGSEKAGIYLTGSQDCTIEDNILYNNAKDGISLYFSSENKISGNTISNDALDSNTHSVFLNNSHNNDLQSNIVSNCGYGIAMRYSNSTNVTANNAYNNNVGIFIAFTSGENTLSNNQVYSNSASGIALSNAGSNNRLINNTARLNTANGISLAGSSNNYLINNNASENSKGIYLQGSSSGNTLSGNIANSNTNRGIELDNAGTNNNITGNIVDSNGGNGIYLAGSSNNYLLNNTVSRNSKGVYIMSSSGSTVSNNMLSDNIAEGIMLSLSDSNILSRNTVFKNSFGIYLNSSDSNSITSNTITDSVNFSIALCAQSSDNDIFDNYFNSTANARIRNSANTWNTTKTAGKSIAGGPYLGGNFWGATIGTGHSQIKPDVNGDGITEEIFYTDNVTDYLPLVTVYVPEPPVYPVANFTTNVTNGKAPLSVLFTDLSQNATSWSWDIDSDGTEDSNETIFIHVYEVPGNYTVNLTVSNENGTASKTDIILYVEADQGGDEDPVKPTADFSVSATSGYAPLSVVFTDCSQNATGRIWDVNNDGVEDSNLASFTYVYPVAGTYTAKLTAINENSTTTKETLISVLEYTDGGSSGGSSKGGGGGGGGSPESSRNIEVKELSQVFITNGNAVKFDFTKNATCVVYVSFDAKKTVGKTTTIVEMLKGKSSLVSELPSDETYKSFNVWVGNSGFVNSKNIDNPVLCFKVEKAWIQDKKIDQSSIALNRYSNKTWEQLPSNISGEDNKYLYFTAEVPGFSSFAITGKVNASPEETVTEIQPGNESDTSEENTENTGSEADPESNEGESAGLPGFEMVYGVIGLIAVFLYKRK